MSNDVQQICAPIQPGQIVEQRAAGERVIGDVRAAQPVHQVVMPHQEPPRSPPLLRRVSPQPEQFRQHVEGRSPLAGEREQRLGAIARQDVVAFSRCAAVQPVDGVAQRPVVLVQEHKGDAL